MRHPLPSLSQDSAASIATADASLVADWNAVLRDTVNAFESALFEPTQSLGFSFIVFFGVRALCRADWSETWLRHRNNDGVLLLPLFIGGAFALLTADYTGLLAMVFAFFLQETAGTASRARLEYSRFPRRVRSRQTLKRLSHTLKRFSLSASRHATALSAALVLLAIGPIIYRQIVGAG